MEEIKYYFSFLWLTAKIIIVIVLFSFVKSGITIIYRNF